MGVARHYKTKKVPCSLCTKSINVPVSFDSPEIYCTKCFHLLKSTDDRILGKLKLLWVNRFGDFTVNLGLMEVG
jgi:hypothetical protein